MSDETPTWDNHPATYSDVCLQTMARFIEHQPSSGLTSNILDVLDPFGGVGGIHRLHDFTERPLRTTCVEIEPEGVATARLNHPRHASRQGDATDLPFPEGTFDVVATSIDFGNRMADKYRGGGPCRACGGTGMVNVDSNLVAARVLADMVCTRCKGTGADVSKRITYAVSLGRDLSEGNHAALQWGQAWREMKVAAFAEMLRVLVPGGLLLLDVKDHHRGRQLQGVPQWCLGAMCEAGFIFIKKATYPVSSMRFGQNGEARTDHAVIYAMAKPL